MEKLTSRQSAAVAVIDQQIEKLEKALAKYKPLFDELAQLKRAKQILMGKPASSAVSVTTEMVEGAFEALGVEKATATTLAEHLGVNPSTMRSHLSRLQGVNYEKDGDGNWFTIEGEDEE